MSLFTTPPWPDAILYDSVARDFLKTGLFRYKVWGDFDPTYLAANFNNGPLYPALHALILSVFHTTDSRWMTSLNILFLLISTLNITKVLQLTGRQLWLLVLILCNPFVLNYVGIIRPDILNLCLFTGIWRLLAVPELKPKRAIGAGLLLGLAALNHQFALFFVPPIVWLIGRHSRDFRDILKNMTLLGASCLAVLTPYIYYIGQHWAAFQFQLFHNQIGESVTMGAPKLIRSFVTPLFYPSISQFTLTSAIPRWFMDGFPLALLFVIGAGIILWRRHQKLSATAKDALVIWLLLNLGCMVSTFNIYVTFSISVVAIALMRDAFPVISKRVKTVLCAAAILGISHQLILRHLVKTQLFLWDEYQVASACLSDALPQNAKVYVMAYPDPSVQLSNWRPDLDIRRYIDFPAYQPAWKKIVEDNSFFITSKDENFFDRFDHGGALHAEIENGSVQQLQCKSGLVEYTLNIK